MGSMENIATGEGDSEFGAYVSTPDAAAPKAAIIVIQEIFGVNRGIRSKCDAWAEAGYLAIAPDLFWRLQPGIALDPDVESEFQQALDWMGKFNQDQGVRDIAATIDHARAAMDGGKVGCVGYCLGGRLAFMAAARTDIDASVGYYGVGIDGLLGEKDAITTPLMLHIPTEDGFVDAATQKAMHEWLDDHPQIVLHDYVGLDHGFATEFGKRRDEEAAQLADGRTAAFFAEHLG
ncbi:dienelactone hydrolase family protein [Alterisphingorhabdus coralli]|uniref:Dienelactone hydrolase family protein n=1 Tax=Alterisphingorhabdus coralli TaxID=3071408 RepID=A0AA97I1M4_9SPHN|nr:dienelactone hydrolase family protein [Parasphingorhabdus sp. SCSIO 66989]WOE75450.1 dienelactone hydrolase family protein [Parasphingorhabdus sp. SCSIO 66989]